MAHRIEIHRILSILLVAQHFEFGRLAIRESVSITVNVVEPYFKLEVVLVQIFLINVINIIRELKLIVVPISKQVDS
jgi:hypothetical protein